MRVPVDLGVFGEYLHYGMPLTLVTVMKEDGSVNVATIASITPLPGEPSRLVMGVLVDNYTARLVEAEREFVVNFVTPELRSAARACGSISGVTTDKMALCGFHPIPARHVRPPLLDESPMNIECRVEHVIKVDDLVLFVSKILVLEVVPELSNGRGGVLVEKLPTLYYAFGRTFARGPIVGDDVF